MMAERPRIHTRPADRERRHVRLAVDNGWRETTPRPRTRWHDPLRRNPRATANAICLGVTFVVLVIFFLAIGG